MKKFKSLPKKMELYCDALAGVKFADSQLTKITPGIAVDLVWEPSNPYDRNAIRVDLNGVKLGYIKAAHTQKLHEKREAAVKLHSFIRSYHPQNPSWEQIFIVIYTDKTSDTDVKF